MKRTLVITLLSILAIAQDHRSANSNTAAQLIQLGDVRSKMFFLAADDMQGRLVGTPEDTIAANYIASEFMSLGLKPLGDDGTYFQTFDIARAWPKEQDAFTFSSDINGQKKSYQRGHEFEGSWAQTVNSEAAKGPIVFLGYGVNAPEYGYNDFAGIDVRGKLVMVLAREPQADDAHSKFKGAWDTYHSYDWYKIEQVRNAGAAGLLIVNNFFAFRESRIPSATPNYLLPEPKYGMEDGLWDLPIIDISPAVADELLSPSGKTIESLKKGIDDSLKPNSFELTGVTAEVSKSFKPSTLIKGRNVVGILEGSDPELKKQYLVVSGHYDHAGSNSTRIYRGADDNASGAIGTIEIADAFVRGGLKPRRSIVFVCFDAEEEGLYGSAYYISHPSVPLADTVANLNMDMIGRDEESLTWHNTAEQNRNMVNVVGTLYNPDIRRVIEQHNQSLGLKLDFKTDTRDPENWFARSDHFWFATKSVPQVLFNTGEQPDYHTENDSRDRINYPKMTKIIQLIFLTADTLANTPQKPAFTP